jgi:ribosomal protein L12E/L44/L45/RPP1/RPP2
MLSSSLKGVVAQVLCKKLSGGRIAALEVMVVNAAISSQIREGKTHQMLSAMQMGKKLGMRLLNDSLLELVSAGHVDAAEAYVKAVYKEDFINKLRGIGVEFDPSTLEAALSAQTGPDLGAAAPMTAPPAAAAPPAPPAAPESTYPRAAPTYPQPGQAVAPESASATVAPRRNLSPATSTALT